MPPVVPHKSLGKGGANVPAPLADPLRGLRTGLVWLNRFTTLIMVAAIVWDLMSGNYFAALVVGCSGLLSNLWLLGVTRLLPDRATDILYLRSFRTDTDTADIRTALERVLGDQFRISGIREPRRRWPTVLRFMSYLVFAFKYAHPKYMNLEAGDEWKGRLWRSLGEARGVVIDVADLTPAVEAEIRLCIQCVGLQRILFVTRSTIHPESWQRLLDLLGGIDGTVELHTAKWQDASQSAEFQGQVLAFANQLPATAVGFTDSARTLAEQLPDQQFRESNVWLIVEIAIGLVLGTIVMAGVNLLRGAGGWGSMVCAGLYFGWAFVVGRQYAEFCRHCGSTSRLRLARQVILPVKLGAVVALLATFVGLLLPDVSKVREAANSVQSQNHLKQLGLAMLLHHDLLSKLPAANAANPSTPWSPHPVSWRVQLLPYLDRDDLYQRYRFDEPWDGPNNRELIPLMPDVYRLPTVEPNEVLMGHTFYRVFGSRPGEQITAAFIDGQAGLRLSAFPDGTTDTLLIVEAAEAVPWTQPECLEFASGQKIPPLGKHYRGGFNGVLADGSTRFFPSRHSESSLRALVSINGGEPIQHE
jgi:hypothetical protein